MSPLAALVAIALVLPVAPEQECSNAGAGTSQECSHDDDASMLQSRMNRAVEEERLDTGADADAAADRKSRDRRDKKFWGPRRRTPPPPPPPPPPTPAPPYKGPYCTDSPEGWKSSADNSCHDYVEKEYCTPDGGYGSGWWYTLWGGFDQYADHNGIDASQACCACGGGRLRPQELCMVSEVTPTYAMTFAFHTNQWHGCRKKHCVPDVFLSQGMGQVFDAVPGAGGSCGCWARVEDGDHVVPQPKKIFLFSHAPASGSCVSTECWTKYAEALRIFKGGDGQKNLSLADDPESLQHWTTECVAREMHLADDHGQGLATAAQLVHSLTGWDALGAVETLLQRLSVTDELTPGEALALLSTGSGSGHGSPLPPSLRSVIGHVANSWNALTSEVLAFLEGLGASAIDHLLGSGETTILGTTFTTENYYILMGKFLVAGMKSKKAMKQWYMDLSNGGKVGKGPGPHTKTYYGWEKCKTLLEGLGAKIVAGTVQRKNELGMQILNGAMWPDAPGGERTIFLGANRENHAYVRPILAEVLDNAKGGADCDGTSCWSSEWLRAQAKAFLSSRDTFETNDLKWYTTQVLHKLHMNVELDETKARAFADYMARVVLPIPFSEEQADSWLLRTVLDIPGTLAKRSKYLEEYKAAIRAKFPERHYTEPEVHLIASAFLDSLQFAGGLSVPAVLAYVLALTHMEEANKWPELKGLLLHDTNIPTVLWETMRMYPAVAGFPYWELMHGKWKHEIVNVARALGDEAVFPDPDTFKLRPLAEYQAKSIGWVDFATYNEKTPGAPHDAPESIAAPHSHRCPGKDLSFQLMVAFLQEFVAAGPWTAVETGITVNSYQASPFTLKKTGATNMCWVQPPGACVQSWVYLFSTYEGCAPDPEGPWCSHYSFHVPGQWSRCVQAPCDSGQHTGESLADTERVVLQAMTACKGGTASAQVKADCACAYANSVADNKIVAQRCSALSAVAQDIGSPFSCVTAMHGPSKHCEVYAPWYANAIYKVTRSWNTVKTWVSTLGDTSQCYATNPQCCSQKYLTTRSAKCSELKEGDLTSDWLNMPSQLQGLFWLQKQGDSSSLISFGRTSDGCGISPGQISTDGKYKVRVAGDRGWSFATTDGGNFAGAETLDLVYEFRFDSASNPTYSQIIPEARNALGLSVPPWLVSFNMTLQPSSTNYPNSVVWKRTSSVVGVDVSSQDYEAVQVVDAAGGRLPAFAEWVSYCEDPVKSGSSSPGYIWLHAYERDPFESLTLEQELGRCPSIVGWIAPPVVDKAFMLAHQFGNYSFHSLIYDPPLDPSVFDDFTAITAVAVLKADLPSFSGRYLTAAERMCPPTKARPLDKFRAQENLAPSEEIDTEGACKPGTAFSFGVGAMCAFLIQREIEFDDGMGPGPENTWEEALKDKPADMTKEGYVMSFMDGYTNGDGDPIYPAVTTDFTKLYFKAGTGWDDMLETKLTIDVLGTHLVSSVQGTPPSKGGETAALVVPLNILSGFARRAGFARWGGDMYFTADGRPLMVKMTAEDGSLKEVWSDAPRAEWEYAKWTFRATMMNAVTLIDHLWFAHLSMANLIATAARERLLPSHPLRRLLSIASFGSIEVNVKAGHALLPSDQVLHRASPFVDWDAVHDAGEDAIQTYEGYFGAVADAATRNSLHPRLKQAPFYQDAPDLWGAISNFLDSFFGVFGEEWCEAGTGLIKEQGLRDYSRAVEDWLLQERPNRAAANLAWVKGGPQGAAWTCAALKKMLTVQLFAVSGWHQHVGKVADLVRNPELVGMSWAPGETAARPRQAIQYLLVSGATGFFGVKINEDFRPLFGGVHKEAEVKAVLDQFRSSLLQLQATIDQRNQNRDMAYTRMHPDYAEVSLYQ